MIKWRVFFCAVPALLVGALFAFIHPAAGVVVAGCVFGLGWDVTRTPKKRGDTDPFDFPR